MATFVNVHRQPGPSSNFSEGTKRLVWNKATSILGYDPNVWRQDLCGAPIRWADYGDTDSKHGWEIDHIWPESKGGSDNIDNLRALQWENNRAKGDSVDPHWSCAVGRK